jgi:hypothetical protein
MEKLVGFGLTVVSIYYGGDYHPKVIHSGQASLNTSLFAILGI